MALADCRIGYCLGCLTLEAVRNPEDPVSAENESRICSFSDSIKEYL